jgi:hypothetical protein
MAWRIRSATRCSRVSASNASSTHPSASSSADTAFRSGMSGSDGLSTADPMNDSPMIAGSM